MHNLCADFLRRLCHQLLLVFDIFGVEDNALQTSITTTAKIFNCLGNIACCIQRHHLTRRNDEHLACIAAANRHRKAAADHVAQNVINNDVRLICFKGLQLCQLLESRDNAAACAANARCRSACLHAQHAAKALEHNVLQLQRLALGLQLLQHRRNALALHQVLRAVALRIAANLHNPVALQR